MEICGKLPDMPFRSIIAAFCALSLAASLAAAQRQMEALNRGLVAFRQPGNKVFISWRLLGTDPQNTAFDVYRATPNQQPQKINPQPTTQRTWYIDENVDVGQVTSYRVRPIVDGAGQDLSAPFMLPANAPEHGYLSVPLQTPEGYSPNDASVGDLDGDGEYEIILHQAGRGHDNAHNGMTDPPILQAYKLDGTLLWTI